MPLSEFYLMNDEQIASLHEQLAENFYDDDLYKTVFMDDRTRLKTLRYLFRHYVKALKPYCHFLADSAECRSVMVVWDSTLEQPLQYHLQLLWLNLKMIPMLAGLRSVKSIRHVIECWDMFTSRWIQEFVQGDYKRAARNRHRLCHAESAACSCAGNRQGCHNGNASCGKPFPLL